VRLLKKTLKYIGIFIAGFIGFVAIYLLSAFCLAKIAVNKNPQPSSDVTIYILTNGVHTDIVVPSKNDQFDWTKEICFANTHLKDTTAMQYLGIGWGDKGFYLQTPTWADLKFSVAFKAAFGLSTTAIHATYHNILPSDSTCRKIMISKEQYGKLVNYITNSLQHDATGHVMHIVTNANYGDSDAFYEAKGSYSMFHTCNTWANNGLKSCEQRACLWTPFDKGIFQKYK
jgi:uncharacterized protein (TIGR02117 family)